MRFASLADLGALAVVLPELDGLRGVEQNRYHHRDVFEHTLEALDFVPGVVTQLGGSGFLATPVEAGLPEAPALVPLMWAVLLHDIGKPAVREVDDDRQHPVLAPRQGRPRDGRRHRRDGCASAGGSSTTSGS